MAKRKLSKFDEANFGILEEQENDGQLLFNGFMFSLLWFIFTELHLLTFFFPTLSWKTIVETKD